MLKFFTIVFVFSFFVCCTAIAQTDTANAVDKQLQACLDSAQNETTYGMIGCEVRARDSWDAALNNYYNMLMQTLSAKEKMLLKTSQRNWLAFHESEIAFCSKMYADMQGTMWGIAKVQADINLIKHRTLELHSYYSDKALH